MAYQPRYEQFTDPVDGTEWRIDVGFTNSNWTCTWGQGCQGILDRPAPELNQGCCSVGAHLIDDEEARLIGALGLMLDPARFQNHAAAAEAGVLADGDQPATRVVDGACIFFNKPGFEGGVGCALHLAALDEDESPLDWKPSICWQAPMKVDHNQDGSKTLRPWGRADWGDDAVLAWCCTEDGEGSSSAYVGGSAVAESLQAELVGLVGPEIAVELRTRARSDRSDGSPDSD
jgi:hypothetical protein